MAHLSKRLHQRERAVVDLTPLIGLDLDSIAPPMSTTSINLQSTPGARREWGELGMIEKTQNRPAKISAKADSTWI